MGRTGFRIDDILKDTCSSPNATVSFGEYLEKCSEYRRWNDYVCRRMISEPQSVDNSLLWLQIYWESLRQCYASISLDTRITVPKMYNGRFLLSENISLPYAFGKRDYGEENSTDSVNNKTDDIEERTERNKINSTNSSKFPSDSPLFELEKLASTKLSSWNSDFCPIKSLLEKKVAPQSRRRKSRTAFTAHQLSELEKVFRKQKYLTPSDRDRIAKLLNLSSPQVITWFQNRRAKFKRDLEEMQNDLLYARKMKKNKIVKTQVNRLKEHTHKDK